MGTPLYACLGWVNHLGEVSRRVHRRDGFTLVETFDGVTFEAGSLTTNQFAEVVVEAGKDPPDPVEILPGNVKAEKLSSYLVRVTIRVEWESPARGDQGYEVTTMVSDDRLNVMVEP